MNSFEEIRLPAQENYSLCLTPACAEHSANTGERPTVPKEERQWLNATSVLKKASKP